MVLVTVLLMWRNTMIGAAYKGSHLKKAHGLACSVSGGAHDQCVLEHGGRQVSCWNSNSEGGREEGGGGGTAEGRVGVRERGNGRVGLVWAFKPQGPSQ